MGIKEKAEQGYYSDENSVTEYAADRISFAADRVKDEGIHQFNKQGQKAVNTTQENIGKTKDKITERCTDYVRTTRLADPSRGCKPFRCPRCFPDSKIAVDKDPTAGAKND